MKEILKFRKIKSKKIKASMIFMAAMVSITGLIVILTSNNKVSDFLEEEATMTLKNLSSQNIVNMTENIVTRQSVLKSIVENIENSNEFDIENIIEMLKLYSETNLFFNLGIMDENGICYTTFGEKLDLSKYEYFKDGMNGVEGISNGYISEDKKHILNIFTIPIYKDDKVKMILTATYRSEDFSNIINTESFDGNGNSIVVDSDGYLVSSVKNMDYKDFDNEGNMKYDMLNEIKEELSKTKDKSEGILNYKFNGVDYLAYYENVGIQDWILISYVPKKFIHKNIDTIHNIIINNSLITYGSIIILLAVILMEYFRYKKRALQIVFFDELTNERNYEYLKLYFEEMNRDKKKDKFLVVMDIDKFRNINIMHGSHIGDELLKYIPSIFKEILPYDEIFKYSADIFIGIIGAKSKEEVLYKISKIQSKIEEDVENKTIVPIKLSFGVCNLNEFDDLHSIYNNALISKSNVKENINRKVSFFDADDKKQIIENRLIESIFADALRNNEFEVWYQPKYNTKTNEIYGAESLVRWKKKSGQIISPASFIPVLEQTGQIIELDGFVIERTFKDIQEMEKLGLDIKPISINLSRVHADNPIILEFIEELQKKYNINPKYVSFEITETALIEDNNRINEIISKIHKMGYKVDIDDYGIGNSTLNSLYMSEFDTLKLDKSFSDSIGNRKMDIIIESTIAMARKLNMKIIAEGIEKKEQVDFLSKHNCNTAQGYYFSKPLDKENYFNLLNNER